MTLILTTACIVALAVSSLAARFIRGWASSRGLMATVNERSSHIAPTPTGGGIAIIIGMWSGLLVWVGLRGGLATSALIGYGAAGFILASLSLVDDLGSLPAIVRLGAHLLVAILIVTTVDRFHAVSLPWGDLTLGPGGYILTALWVVGLINAYNFMDGIDGMAACTAVVAALSWAILSSGGNELTTLVLGLTIAGACVGFLLHNWQPATIFMGDVGSAYLGLTFAVLPLLSGTARSPSAWAPLVGGLIVWPFVFDAGVTFTRRAWRRERVLEAHRSHLYQRLVIAGYTHRQVSGLYALLAASGGVLAWLVTVTHGDMGLPAVAFVLVLGGGLVGGVRLAERRMSTE